MDAEGRDPAFLWDMLTTAREVQQIVVGIAQEAYLEDRVKQLAIERGIEIIGEAARQVSEAFRQAHPEISWRGIVAQRHVLAHDYGRIDHERMWNVATVQVPELIARSEPLIPPLPPTDEE